MKSLLGPLTLRRMKTQIRDGRPIVELPKRYVFVEHIELSEEERKSYDSMQTEGKHIVRRLTLCLLPFELNVEPFSCD